MTIYQVGKSWYYDFYHNGVRYKKAIGRVNRTVAMEIETAERGRVIRGEYVPRKTPIDFDEFIDKLYLPHCQKHNRPSGYTRKDLSCRHLKEYFGDRRLGDIKPEDVDKYQTKRLKDGVKNGTVNREVAALKHAFSLAIKKWGKVDTNPVKAVDMLDEPMEKDRILSPQEEVRLLGTLAANTTAKNRHLYAIIITALNTGMRRMEILKLRWSDVDFGNRIITVTGTKTGWNRQIPMNTVLTETLKNVKKQSPGEYVFTVRGEPVKAISTAWYKATKEAGLEGLRLHDLRHTFGSRLGMAGVDLRTIMKLMGHREIKTTMRYSHPTQEHERKAVETVISSHTNFPTTPDRRKKGRLKILK